MWFDHVVNNYNMLEHAEKHSPAYSGVLVFAMGFFSYQEAVSQTLAPHLKLLSLNILASRNRFVIVTAQTISFST
jgi:hypothetical protein